ncbi:MAG TPA: MarR family transcriptional regulator [Steroidobacter sp.]|uniref:MarR family winged helix-turn-helix transcriptional regulator n=1 Tax=Steroidobacter sp. TaxID=1978227 RepID=UPI002ED85617
MAQGKRATAQGAGSSARRTALDDSMGYLVRKTFRAFTRALEQRLAEHDVSISMWFFLRRLWEGDGLTQKDLSAELGLTQPTTVAAMDNLERRGLIRRSRNPDDRRKINIYLTSAGKDLKRSLSKYATEINEIALSGFSKSEVATLRDMLLRILDALSADAAAHGDVAPSEDL